MSKRALYLGIATLSVVACVPVGKESGAIQSGSPSSPALDVTVFDNAQFYTEDDANPLAEAVVVGDGKFLFVGSSEQALDFAGESADVRDLEGQFVLPGLVDAHTHPGLIALNGPGEGDDGDVMTMPRDMDRQETLDWLKEYSQSDDLPDIIRLGEWDVEAFFPDGPNRYELDEIFPDRPVLLSDNSGHTRWLNSAAIDMYGVTSETPDVSPGISYFVRDENGEPTGWVKEFALMPYMDSSMISPPDELKANMTTFLDFLSSRGVTTLFDAGNFIWDDEIYAVVSELAHSDRLPLNYEGSYHIWNPNELDSAVSEVRRLRDEYAFGRFTINTVKVHYDGVHEVATAAEVEPYAIPSLGSGGKLFSTERLVKLMVELDAEKIDLHLHTVGSDATKSVLDAVELATAELGRPLNIEVTVAHVEYVSPPDIQRAADLGVNVDFTPHWFGGSVFGGAGAALLGPERAKQNMVVEHFVDAGANVTLSSDVVSWWEYPRADPFIGIEMAVTRREYTPGDHPFKQPESAKMERDAAIKAYTVNSAKQFGKEDSIGTIQVGKDADFVVLKDDPYQIKISKMDQMRVDSVYLDGELVYSEE